MPVKIIEFEAENIKRVKAFQIVPALNGLTIIGGDNNQGKTSVLEAIAVYKRQWQMHAGVGVE